MWFLPSRKTRRAPSGPRLRTSCRPRLEALESRCLLSAGALDTTFGTGGTVTLGFGQTDSSSSAFVRAVLVYPSTDATNGGKVLAVGCLDLPNTTTTGNDFALLRYLPNGTLDSTFGSGGLVTTDFASGNDIAYGVALDASGKIVVVGSATITTSYSILALARYNPDGSLDTTFGGTGKVTTAAGAIAPSSLEARGIVIQPDDGKIVVGGTFNDSAFIVARYFPDGTLDAGFGTGGVTTNVIAKGSRARAIALQADHKIVLLGDAYNGSDFDFAAARYNPDGTLDPTFGTGGTVTTPIGTNTSKKPLPSYVKLDDEAVAVAEDAGGRVVLAGYSTSSTGRYAALVRYTPGGALDTTFGSSGKVTTDLGNHYSWARSLALQPDGKIVVAGADWPTTSTTDSVFALARYNVNGTLDSTFGSGGKVSTNFTRGDDQAVGMALQADGKIVAAGYAANGYAGFALARYLGDPPAAPTNVTAAAVSSSQINLTWTATSTNVTGYFIERSTDGINFTQVAAVDAGLTSFSDTGLSPKTKYYYRLRASNANGYSNFSAIVNALTPAQ